MPSAVLALPGEARAGREAFLGLMGVDPQAWKAKEDFDWVNEGSLSSPGLSNPTVRMGPHRRCSGYGFSSRDEALGDLSENPTRVVEVGGGEGIGRRILILLWLQDSHIACGRPHT